MNPLPPRPQPAVDREALPVAYTIWRFSQRCRNCGRTHEHSELFERLHIRGQWGRTLASEYRSMNGNVPQYNLPIQLKEEPLKSIAFCHACAASVSLRHLPPVPAIERQMPPPPSWCGKGLAEEGAAGTSPRKKEAPIPMTLDSLSTLLK